MIPWTWEQYYRPSWLRERDSSPSLGRTDYWHPLIIAAAVISESRTTDHEETGALQFGQAAVLFLFKRWQGEMFDLVHVSMQSSYYHTANPVVLLVVEMIVDVLLISSRKTKSILT